MSIITGRVLPAVLIVAALVAGCTTSHGQTAAAPPEQLRAVDCPGDVELVLVITHACFRLRVPEAPGSSAQDDLFVLRLTPSGPPSADPLLILGSDLGDTPDYGGYGPAPNRVHRVVYVIDARGTGHSEPSLSCPEADAVSLGSSTEADQLTQAALGCRQRLEAQGLDLSAYGPSGVARDVTAVRRALGVPVWNLETLGTTSAYLPAIVAADPGTVRAVVVDSPFSAASGAAETVDAWQALVADCRRDRACTNDFPDADQLWEKAAAKVASSPLPVGAGPKAVEVDPGVLARFVRSMLAGEGPDVPGRLMRDLADVATGRAPTDLVRRVSGGGSCLGYRPLCPGRSFSLGAYLSAICTDHVTAPPTEPPAIPGAAALDARADAKACSAWPTRTLENQTLPVPTLELHGALDPFSSPAPPGGASPGRHVVVMPNETHNTLGYHECPLAIRNAWLDEPSDPPATECVAEMPHLVFT